MVRRPSGGRRACGTAEGRSLLAGVRARLRGAVGGAGVRRLRPAAALHSDVAANGRSSSARPSGARERISGQRHWHPDAASASCICTVHQFQRRKLTRAGRDGARAAVLVVRPREPSQRRSGECRHRELWCCFDYSQSSHGCAARSPQLTRTGPGAFTVRVR
jgi:hypothetical protein